MRKITSLTSSANQSVTIVTNEGVYYKLTLRYLPTQLSWVMDIVSDNFKLYNQRVGCSVNVLDKYHNILNFGLAVWTIDGLDPMNVEDFDSGYAEIYIFNKDEKEVITEYLDGIRSKEV